MAENQIYGTIVAENTHGENPISNQERPYTGEFSELVILSPKPEILAYQEGILERIKCVELNIEALKNVTMNAQRLANLETYNKELGSLNQLVRDIPAMEAIIQKTEQKERNKKLVKRFLASLPAILIAVNIGYSRYQEYQKYMAEQENKIIVLATQQVEGGVIEASGKQSDKKDLEKLPKWFVEDVAYVQLFVEIGPEGRLEIIEAIKNGEYVETDFKLLKLYLRSLKSPSRIPLNDIQN
jgi:hypothetical protein